MSLSYVIAGHSELTDLDYINSGHIGFSSSNDLATEILDRTNADNALQIDINGRELFLGNPASNGYVLQSTAAGIRSWLNLAIYATLGANTFTGKQRVDGTSGVGVEVIVTSGTAISGNASSGIGVYAYSNNVALFAVSPGGTPAWVQNVTPSNNTVVPGLYLVASPTSPSAGTGIKMEIALQTTTTRRNATRIITKYASAGDVTDATRAATLEFQVSDYTADRTFLAGRANGTAPEIGFLGSTPIARPIVTGSRGGNAALESLITALATLGLITDTTTV